MTKPQQCHLRRFQRIVGPCHLIMGTQQQLPQALDTRHTHLLRPICDGLAVFLHE